MPICVLTEEKKTKVEYIKQVKIAVIMREFKAKQASRKAHRLLCN